MYYEHSEFIPLEILFTFIAGEQECVSFEYDHKIEGTKLTLHSNNRSPIKATYLIANTLIATIAKTLGSDIAVQLADKISKSIHRH